jgi:hypothetical protein
MNFRLIKGFYFRVLLSLELCMADCYLNIDVKHHTDALSLYQKILSEDENNILALQV